MLEVFVLPLRGMTWHGTALLSKLFYNSWLLLLAGLVSYVENPVTLIVTILSNQSVICSVNMSDCMLRSHHIVIINFEITSRDFTCSFPCPWTWS